MVAFNIPTFIPGTYRWTNFSVVERSLDPVSFRPVLTDHVSSAEIFRGSKPTVEMGRTFPDELSESVRHALAHTQLKVPVLHPPVPSFYCRYVERTWIRVLPSVRWPWQVLTKVPRMWALFEVSSLTDTICPVLSSESSVFSRYFRVTEGRCVLVFWSELVVLVENQLF